MGGEPRLVGIGHALAHHLEQRVVFLRHRVADGVGDVDGGRAGLDGGLDAAAQEVVLGAGAVLARPLDVVGVVAGAGDGRDHEPVDLLGLHLQLPLHVHRRGGDEGVDAPAPRRPDRLAAAVDVLLAGAGEAADHRVPGAHRDLVDGGEVALGGDREAGLDDVDAHGVEHLGDLELLLVGHGGAGRLLAVPQGGVEYDDAVLVGRGLRGHGNVSFCSNRAAAAPSGCVHIPLSAQARTPGRPSGADKEQDPKHKGSIRPGRCSPPSDRADMAPHRHAVILVAGPGCQPLQMAH